MIARLFFCFALSSFVALSARWIVKDYFIGPSFFSVQFLTYGLLNCFLGVSLFLVGELYAYPYSFSYQIVIAILGITLFTDAYVLLISRFFTWYLVPLVWVAAYYRFLPLSLPESVGVSIVAYALLRFTYWLSGMLMGKEAMGAGDIDLFTFIGAATGLYGAWFALTVGSCVCALYGIVQILCGADRTKLQLPLGTFLTIGAILYLVI